MLGAGIARRQRHAPIISGHDEIARASKPDRMIGEADHSGDHRPVVDYGKRLSRQARRGEASRDDDEIAQGLPLWLDRLAERDTHVLGGMVMIDVQITFGVDHDVDA